MYFQAGGPFLFDVFIERISDEPSQRSLVIELSENGFCWKQFLVVLIGGWKRSSWSVEKLFEPTSFSNKSNLCFVSAKASVLRGLSRSLKFCNANDFGLKILSEPEIEVFTRYSRNYGCCNCLHRFQGHFERNFVYLDSRESLLLAGLIVKSFLKY